MIILESLTSSHVKSFYAISLNYVNIFKLPRDKFFYVKKDPMFLYHRETCIANDIVIRSILPRGTSERIRNSTVFTPEKILIVWDRLVRLERKVTRIDAQGRGNEKST